MGFFSKIKQNFQHGGVTVAMQAPSSVSRQDPALPVTVTITNGPDSARTIKRVTVEVQVTERNSGVGMSLNNTVQLGNTTNSNQMNNMQTFTLAKADSAETFTLQPNESKTVTLTIVVNDGTSSPTDGIMGHMIGVMNSLTQKQYTYTLRASSDVDGIALDPHAHQTLQIV